MNQPDPSSHKDTVAKYATADSDLVKAAIDAALAAKPSWETTPFADRAAIFLKAADLISGKYRYEVMAATMVGQGKNAWQAEIDAAAELCDFLRSVVLLSTASLAIIDGQQIQRTLRRNTLLTAACPQCSGHLEVRHSRTKVMEMHSDITYSRVEYRALEGFVYAVTPFNFSAIGGNLPAAPTLMGNVVLWKPSPSAVASNWIIYNIFREAGLPANVIQFVPGDAEEITKTVLASPKFSALHYTGSTAVFRSLYGKISQGVADGKYESYPRIVGETGGKNFHLIHRSANISNAVINTVRGAFEYQGQKCSACSRVYVPTSIASQFTTQLADQVKKLRIGDPADLTNLIGPVIHEAAFNRLKSVIDDAKNDKDLELLVGGTYDSSKGYFIHPTVYTTTTNSSHPLLSRELFGPILVIHTYPDTPPSDPTDAFAAICRIINTTTSYALTGAVFAQDRAAIRLAEEALRHSAGNFYINCKCTGAVVGQQPFGGGRGSGTNDKAGSANLLTRFVSMRAVKEQFFEDAEVEYLSNKG